MLMEQWSISSWRDLASFFGIAGFFLSWLIPLGTFLYKRYSDRIVLRFETHAVPGLYKSRGNIEDFEFSIHHDKGRPFRFGRIQLDFHIGTVVSDATVKEYRARRGGCPILLAFPRRIRINMLDAGDNEPMPLISAGDSMRFTSQLQHDWPWDLLHQSSSFAKLRLYSQGKLVWEYDISDVLRSSIPMFIEWRRGNGLLIVDRPKQEVIAIDPV